MTQHSLSTIEDCTRHLRNSLARQDDRLPKGMRALITTLLGMYGRERLAGGHTLRPRTDDLCKRVKASERTVQGHMRSLINWGFVVPVHSHRGRGKPNVFTLNVNALIAAIKSMGYRFSHSLVTKIRDVADAVKVPFKKRQIVHRMAAKKPAVFTRPIYKIINTVLAEGSVRAKSNVERGTFGSVSLGRIGSRLLASATGPRNPTIYFDMAGAGQ